MPISTYICCDRPVMAETKMPQEIFPEALAVIRGWIAFRLFGQGGGQDLV